jgi:hypothetical protein
VVVVHLITLPPQAVALAVVLVMALVLLLVLEQQIKATLAGQMFLMSPVVEAGQVVSGSLAQAPAPTTGVMVAQGFLLT